MLKIIKDELFYLFGCGRFTKEEKIKNKEFLKSLVGDNRQFSPFQHLMATEILSTHSYRSCLVTAFNSNSFDYIRNCREIWEKYAKEENK
jgi:hypothetical protein